MKVVVFDWCACCPTQLKAAGYEHNQELELDEQGLKDLVLHLFNHRINVMLLHRDSGRVVVAVDTSRFQQR